MEILNFFNGEVILDTDGRLVLARDSGNPERHRSINLGYQPPALKRCLHDRAIGEPPLIAAFLRMGVIPLMHMPRHPDSGRVDLAKQFRP
jgi:hypothetical protein